MFGARQYQIIGRFHAGSVGGGGVEEGGGGPTGASRQFPRRNCLRCKALTGGLLRGKESIRQGSLQSGQLLKMQQHHYGLTQPKTSVSLAARLCVFPSDIHLSISPL